MENEEIIRDVEELLKLPGIGKSLFHKIKELKAILTQHIDEYRPLIENLPSEKKGLTPRGIQFELCRVVGHLWIPALPGGPGYNAADVMPQPLINYIVNFQAEPGVIEMKPGLILPDLPGKIFDLTFEKTGPDYIWGMINTRMVNQPGIIYAANQVDQRIFADLGENTEKNEVLKLLLYYLVSYEDFYNQVTAEFKYHWKPLIDSELIGEASF